MTTIFKKFKPALLFLAQYLVLYVVLNTGYAFYIDHYRPNADPATLLVTSHTVDILSVFESGVTMRKVPGSMNVAVDKRGATVIEVFEGCNSINVMIILVAFLIAFKGPGRLLWSYLAAGISAIYAINLLRVTGLFYVAYYFPESLYFFHKFFFTGIIYLLVFAIWYFWVQAVKKWSTPNDAPVSQ